MTAKQKREEIKQIVNELPEDNLANVLVYLKKLQQNIEDAQIENFMEQTLIEDKELLEKLAR